MKAQDIRVGDILKLKSGIYAPEYQWVHVARIEERNGYKVPWIFNVQGEAFQPRDFQRRATESEIRAVASW